VLRLLTLQIPAAFVLPVLTLKNLCSTYTGHFYGWYDSSNNVNSNGSKLYYIRYEPNHKMHINFSLWRVQRDARLETYATGQYAALRLLLWSICFVLSRRSWVLCKVYVPLLRDIEFLELPILNQQWKICTAQRSQSHVRMSTSQNCSGVSAVSKASVRWAKTLMIYTLGYTACNHSFQKRINKNGKEWNITFHNGKFHASKTLVYAIPCC
jgi:hypothetical protein